MSLGIVKCEARQSSQNQFLPLPSTSEKISRRKRIDSIKNIVVGGTLIYTFLFLNPNPFRVLDPIYAKGHLSEFPQCQKASHQSIAKVEWGQLSVL